ncbi:hypothetical protein A6X21_18880 [Planctopirus hydrillae]|uniref:Uncharacterized protein n=1 Tax=Planctopirus hydrillae TaxID=1841610 RepID=A0A1C3EJF3_9PLAN|nr:hypothetical protein A6X21_18880 [Planctopirus hydrillae]
MPLSTWQERWRKEHGDFAIPCIVSERYLQFSDSGTQRIGAGEVITLSVMTDASEKGPKKLCELIITREELTRVLELIEPASNA